MIDDLKIKGYWESRKVFIGGEELTPYYSQSLRNHSPDGFNWGYSGSGPAQLALALLIHFSAYSLGEQVKKVMEFALCHYQAFKFNVIATLPQSDFELDGNEILDWIKKRKIKEEDLCNSGEKSTN